MRPVYSFPEGVADAIARERYRHPDPRVQQRMEILWLKSRNQVHGDIADLARVSRSTVQRTLRIYAAQGLDGSRSFGWNTCRSPSVGPSAKLRAGQRRSQPARASKVARVKSPVLAAPNDVENQRPVGSSDGSVAKG